jgi:hypothetical protein
MDCLADGTRATSLPQLEAQLIHAYGVIVGGAQLARALGYPTQQAFRQAVARGRVPVPLFTIPGRRGKFAQSQDIARWAHGLGSDPATQAKTRPFPKDATAGRCA